MLGPEPLIPILKLSPKAAGFANRIVSTRGTTRGRLLASAPPCGYGEIYYVWRMVKFAVSPDPRASCMPVSADVGVGPDVPMCTDSCARTIALYAGERDLAPCSCGKDTIAKQALEVRRRRIAELNAIVNEIVDSLPIDKQYGIRRWSRAMHGVDPGTASDPDGAHSLPMMAAVQNPADEVHESLLPTAAAEPGSLFATTATT